MLITPKILPRLLIAQLLMSTGVLSCDFKKRAQKRQSLILMYHRITRPSQTDEYIEPGMYVTPETFKMHLNLLLKYFHVVSLHTLLESNGKNAIRPLCSITFDDGWYDFYTHAYPILRDKKVPATVFLPTNFIGTSQWFWTDRLSTILKNSIVSPVEPILDSLALKIAHLSGSLFSRIDNAIKLLKPYSRQVIEHTLNNLELNIIGKKHIEKKAFLDWSDCHTLKNSGIISFGSHTANHVILSSETDQVCFDELEISKNKLLSENVVDKEFIPFCYPNGGFSEKCARIVEETGYHCAVTTIGGWVDKNDNRFKLHRVGIHQDMTATNALMAAKVLR
jgi:peptidoglycan/xylan/chitin deacetylase (PgdA/CDA1 family)